MGPWEKKNGKHIMGRNTKGCRLEMIIKIIKMVDYDNYDHDDSIND
jgi:hypothetical protein